MFFIWSISRVGLEHNSGDKQGITVFDSFAFTQDISDWTIFKIYNDPFNDPCFNCTYFSRIPFHPLARPIRLSWIFGHRYRSLVDWFRKVVTCFGVLVIYTWSSAFLFGRRMLHFMGFDLHTFITALFSLHPCDLPAERLMEGAKLWTNDDEIFLKELSRFLSEPGQTVYLLQQIQWR